MMRARIVVTRRWPADVEARLATMADVAFNRDDRPFDADQVTAALATAYILLPTVTDRIGAAVLGTRPRTRLIANFGVGVNHIDLAAAKALGIAVSNTPGVLTDCTADLAMTLMLMAARRAGEGERHVRSGAWVGWRPTHMVGSRVTGKTLGIIGMGRIGQAVARRAHAGFGMTVLYHSRQRLDGAIEAALGATKVPLANLLARSDFVSLHCPSTPETRHIIDAARLAAMRPTAILINTARGDVVDEAALASALGEGRIAAAGLDVYEREPAIEAALMGLENVVLLPHLGSATAETRTAMGDCVLDNVAAFLAGRPLPNPVG
ncbi:MAG: D-glycerate dehydrogenase [Alphaproteobacteria bacterium]|nr:D-glycerate dehydrogenase [Alphaproteobacteria bacterium]